MLYFIIFFILLIGLALIARPITVLIHELGHAIPAILLTNQKATIYIGSYGDPANSIKINLGFLTIYFRYNLLAWRLGLCVPEAKATSINRQILYTFTGPIASLLVATIACYFTFAYDLHGFLKIFLIVFLGSAILDLFINLVPNSTPIKLYDGRITYNDGYSLKQLFYYKQLPKAYSEALDLYNKQNYAEASLIFDELAQQTKDENIFRLAISSYLLIKNYKKAKEISDSFKLTGKMNSDDYTNMAISYSFLSQHEEALKIYDLSLELNPENYYSLNNKGYTLNLLSKYEDAIIMFDKAIILANNFAYSYNNRGLAKIKMGFTEEGLKDIRRSLELDPNNSYAYLNMGIYHFEKGEFEIALQKFMEAKEIDSSTFLIDNYINDTQKKMALLDAKSKNI